MGQSNIGIRFTVDTSQAKSQVDSLSNAVGNLTQKLVDTADTKSKIEKLGNVVESFAKGIKETSNSSGSFMFDLPQTPPVMTKQPAQPVAAGFTKATPPVQAKEALPEPVPPAQPVAAGFTKATPPQPADDGQEEPQPPS
jgi:hypothetical protein